MVRVGFKRYFLLASAMVLPVSGLASQPIAPSQSGQGAPIAQPVPVIQPGQTASGAADSRVAEAPVALPPVVWTTTDAAELLTLIQSVGSEGLTPADYDPQGLLAAMSSGDRATLSQVASDRFRRVAADLALGHVRGTDRQQWLIPDPDMPDERLDQLMRWALAEQKVGVALRDLLPTHPQYAALKQALASAPAGDAALRNRIRLNMDRWRWLPRDLGERYIIVNVPAYTAALVVGGETLSRHRAVAGAVKTPTPQLQATASGVILNPWWEVPKSIEGEVRGRRGYVPVKSDSGKIIRWRQPPGPANALGKMKFVMPNDEAIYLHDTNARGLFDTKSRAYSHGCIRTEHVADLATKLLVSGGDGEWSAQRVKDVLASGKTVQANFPAPLPVYIVYFSSVALAEGEIKNYDDIYSRDDKVIAALLDKRQAPNQVASR